MRIAKGNIMSEQNILKAAWLKTPLGPMLAIANNKAIYLLEFEGRRGLERELEKLKKKTRATIVSGKTKPIESIEKELKIYFKQGDFKKTNFQFKTPFCLLGTPFQKKVWQTLMKIPFGQTWSYSDLAKALGKPTAFRAVANANGANQIAIVIPCHRVINANGGIGGYGGGISRKRGLLALEKNK